MKNIDILIEITHTSHTLENTQPDSDELLEDVTDITGNSRLPTDVNFWRKFGKMVQRIS